MKKIIVGIGVVLLMTTQLAATQSEVETGFRSLADQTLENLMSYFPVSATTRGIHEYDDRFADYSEEAVASEISRLKEIKARLNEYVGGDLSEDSRVNLKLLKSNVDIAILNLSEIRWHEKSPFLYINDAINGVYLILASEYAPLEIRAGDVISRMKAVPKLLEQARKNLKNPPPTFIRLARRMTDDGIALYRKASEELSLALPELSAELIHAAEEAISAIEGYRDYLDNVEPGPKGSFAIGRRNFDFKLQNEYMLGYDCDSLLKIGESLLAEINQKMAEYDERARKDGAGIDSIYIIDCLEKEDILNYYRWETEQTKLFLKDKDILTVPDNIGECRVIETPEFLRSVVSFIAYEPPGVFSPSQTGYFYVPPLPDDMDSEEKAANYRYIHGRGFKPSVCHEAFPGHHLHFQKIAAMTDSVRMWQFNLMSFEGWALYCEEMMYDQGLYGNDNRPYRQVLDGVKLRAARIVVDVKLQTGQFNRDEALAWFAAEMDADTTSWTPVEIDYYTVSPTIPMSYLIGKIEIINLLEAVRNKEGDDFSLKAFHDRFLSEGGIPPQMLWRMWGLTE